LSGLVLLIIVNSIIIIIIVNIIIIININNVINHADSDCGAGVVFVLVELMVESGHSSSGSLLCLDPKGLIVLVG